MKQFLITLAIISTLTGLFFLFREFRPIVVQTLQSPTTVNSPQTIPASPLTSSMSIEALRSRKYPGSKLVIEEQLSSGINYSRTIVSYTSDNLKIYGLLTIPTTQKPDGGHPAIIIMHGYITPETYDTVRNYANTQDWLARNGFVTFKPDLRGHGRSEGEAVGAHFSEAYVIDTLHALSALQLHPDVNPKRIGYFGHSNGGEIGLRSMVITSEIKAGVFWAGVVGSFEDMLETYNAKIPFMRRSTPELVTQYGLPSSNPTFWQLIDPYYYLGSISAPIQLHHGTADDSVPIELSLRLEEELTAAGKTVEYYEYAGADHNLSQVFGKAMQRTIEFYRKNL
jgi:dipeptidyl aminopeptidase/acylaminoacyl peptidase